MATGSTGVTIGQVGTLVQFGVSFLLVGVFALLIPLHTQRRVVFIWITVWLAQMLTTVSVGVTALYYLLASPGARLPEWFSWYQDVAWPAQLVFHLALAFAALAAAGWRIAPRAQVWALIGMAALGLLLAGQNLTSVVIALVATFILSFGPAQAILFRARGPRRNGLIVLASALTLNGALEVLQIAYPLLTGATTPFARFAGAVTRSAGYSDAAALGILAAAAVVVIVQEAFLETSRAHAERLEGIAASEALLDGIIQAAQEAIVTVDAGGRIELVNTSAERLLALPRRDLLGRALSEFVVETATPIAELIGGDGTPQAGAARASAATFVAKGKRGDGATFPLEFTVGQLRAEGRAGAVIVLHDLTARNAAQEERERFGRRVAESEKMVAIGRVVSGVAHELNNPLAVVLGQSEQLVETTAAGEVAAGLRLINEHAHRARHIVKDLLAFVRHRDEARELVNVSSLANNTLASQRNAGMLRGVSVATNLPAGLPNVLGDRAGIEQVFINLLDNAIDAVGPDGTVQVSARTTGSEVELVVEDAGPGVPDEHVGRVFEPFFTTKSVGQGTGLGLSVSLGIAQQHSGTIRLENRPAPGVGARFVLSLPVAPAEAASAQRSPATMVFPRPPARGDGSVGEVMLIDDEPDVRSTLARMFRRAGWAVREAASGDEGLVWLSAVSDSETPAVILCDLKMPGLSGRELYEQLAACRPTLSPRVVFVTGDVVESVSTGFIARSGREVVEKPFTIAEIALAVERTIEATRA